MFAAASTIDAVTALAEAFERQKGVEVVCNFAASSVLARQIEAGAPCDVFLSADADWMDHLEKLGLIETGSRRDVASNELVLIAPAGRRFEAKMEPGFAIENAFAGRLAVGDPDHVPAGRYTKQALKSLGWWGRLEGRLVPAMDVRAALRLVELGEADAGIVYASDASASRRVEVIGKFPKDSHDPIRYPAALCRGASAEGRAWLAFLSGPGGQRVFADHGFTSIADCELPIAD